MSFGPRLLALVALALVLPVAEASFAAKKTGKSKKPSKPASTKGGFGSKATAAVKAGPTPAQLLKTSMQQFEAIEKMRNQQNSAEADELRDNDGEAEASENEVSAPGNSVTKWCVTLRSSTSQEFSDWVPVALLALACSDGDDPASLMPSALGASVKEVLEGGSQAQPALRKVGRETFEYAYEPLDSFETHVYEGLQGRGERRSEAAETLGVAADASAGDVKKAHRRLMMELHPDRFVGDEDGAAAAQARMLEVQEAYSELGGGQGSASGSFYASIGGKARVSFSGLLAKEALAPLGKPRPAQEAPLEGGGWRVGIMPMQTSITREFVTRNLMRSKDE